MLSVELAVLELIDRYSRPPLSDTGLRTRQPEATLLNLKLSLNDWTHIVNDLAKQGYLEKYTKRFKEPILIEGFGRQKSITCFRTTESGRELLKELGIEHR